MWEVSGNSLSSLPTFSSQIKVCGLKEGDSNWSVPQKVFFLICQRKEVMMTTLADYVRVWHAGFRLAPRQPEPTPLVVATATDKKRNNVFVAHCAPERRALGWQGLKTQILREIAEENRAYFRAIHRACRLGRRGRRPAQKPRYKQVRREGLHFRKHAPRKPGRRIRYLCPTGVVV
jgi:hypothetical protein